MDHVSKRLSCAEANKMDMVDYLATIGYGPKNIRANDFWYISPFRNESTPSFKVNRKDNIWFDHGEGKGGNFVDFCLRYHQCSVSELLRKLEGNTAALNAIIKREKQVVVDDANHIIITAVRPLSNVALLQYAQSRRVPEAIIRHYCQEVDYTNGNKSYYAIGFKNDSGGYELRSKYFKGSSAPKDITHFKNGHSSLAVFEGSFNFFSFQTLQQNKPLPPTDFLILNSLSFFEKARYIMEGYKEANLYLDNNKAGQKFSAYAASLSPVYKDRSGLYTGYEDCNDLLLNKPQNKSEDLPKKRKLRL
jgi:hypothetical protein